MMNQISLFDHSDYLETLAKHKDPLEKLDGAIDWFIFRSILDRCLKKDRKSNAGRPPYDALQMLKVIVLQSLYGLSDAQTEFQILDRYTFKRFLCIKSEADIPDEKTIWLFKERLGNEGVKRIFRKFSSEMDKAGFSAKKGSIVHVFGRMKHLRSDMVRCVGLARATMRIGLANLVYNMDRIASMGGLRPKAA